MDAPAPGFDMAPALAPGGGFGAGPAPAAGAHAGPAAAVPAAGGGGRETARELILARSNLRQVPEDVWEAGEYLTKLDLTGR